MFSFNGGAIGKMSWSRIFLPVDKFSFLSKRVNYKSYITAPFNARPLLFLFLTLQENQVMEITRERISLG